MHIIGILGVKIKLVFLLEMASSFGETYIEYAVVTHDCEYLH